MAGVKLRYAASGSPADVCRRVPRCPSLSISSTLQQIRHSSRRAHQAGPAIAGPGWTHHSHPQTLPHNQIYTHPQAASRTKLALQTRPHTCSGVSPVSPVSALGATTPTAPPPRPAAHFIYADCLSDNSRRLNFASVSAAGSGPCSSPSARRTLHPLFDQRRNFSSTTATMVATKIDGNAIAKSIRERLSAEVAAKQKLNPRYQPCLKIIQGMPW